MTELKPESQLQTLTAERDALDVLAQERLKSVKQARAERDALKKECEQAAMDANEAERGEVAQRLRAERAESALGEARGRALEECAQQLETWAGRSANLAAQKHLRTAAKALRLKAEDVPPQEGKP